MSFTNVFGGGTLNPAEVAYRAVALSASVALAWPPLSQSAADLAARTMDVTPSGPGFTITLPPANQVSTGYDLILNNRGASSFSVLDNAGGAIVTIAPGASKYVQVVDNTSPAGMWTTLAFGAVTSAADAASLVNNLGVSAVGPYLYASGPTTTFSAGNTIAAADRAKVYVWTGGSGTQTLPAVGSVGSDFWYEVRNQGTGTLTLAANGAELIDGASTIAFQPTESAVIHGGVGNWYTVGRGRSVQFSFTLLVKGITGGTVTLTSTEAANVVQRYTGVLVSNASIVLPSVVQVYYVSNQTTGAFSVTFKTSGVGTTVSVPTGQNAVLFCDGLNVINTSTTVSGLTSLTLAQGSVSVPSLNYSGDTSTGLYQSASGHVNVSISGVGVVDVSATGVAVSGAVSGTTGAFSGLITAATAPTLPAHLTNKAYVDAQVSGGGFLSLTGGTMTGQIQSTNAEPLRMEGASPFLSGYNAANTVRTGYLQFAAGTAVTLAAENSAILQFSTAGTVRVNVDASGNVGVGLTPTYKLDVLSGSGIPARVRSSTASSALMLGDSGTTLDSLYIGTVGNDFRVVTSNVEHLRVSPTTTTISYSTGAQMLLLSASASTDPYLIVTDGTINGFLQARITGGAVVAIGALSNHALALYTNNTEKARLTASGKFGIGLTPTARLEVGAVTDSANDINVNASGTGLARLIANANGAAAILVSANVSGSTDNGLPTGAVGIATVGANPFIVAVNGTIRFQISAAGIISDGTTELGWKGLPINGVSSLYTLVQADNGKKVIQTGAFNVQAATGLSADFACVVINRSGSGKTLVSNGATLLLSGTATTGDRTLASNAVCSITHIGSNVLMVSGPGVT